MISYGNEMPPPIYFKCRGHVAGGGCMFLEQLFSRICKHREFSLNLLKAILQTEKVLIFHMTLVAVIHLFKSLIFTVFA